MASVFGVFTISEDNEAGAPPSVPKFGILTLRGEGCKILEHLQRNKKYKLPLQIKTRNNRFELSINHYEVPDEVDVVFPSAKDAVIEAFKPIAPSEAGRNIGNNKLVLGIVIKHQIKQIKNGQRMGITEISDISASIKSQNTLSIKWFNEPEFANRYNSGSTCYFLVDIKENKTGYGGLSVTGTCVIPVLAAEDVDVFDDQGTSEWF
jgi:hypothetical protein